MHEADRCSTADLRRDEVPVEQALGKACCQFAVLSWSRNKRGRTLGVLAEQEDESGISASLAAANSSSV
jgi:hypothetical protein